MNRSSDPPEVQVVFDAIRRIVQALRLSASAAQKSAGISGAQLFVLQKLAEAPAHALNELAGRTRTHPSSLSVVVQRLVERGLVARQRSAEDGRRLELVLTEPGRQLLQTAPNPIQQRLLEGLERLEPHELNALARLLERWVGEAGLAGEAARLFFEDDEPAPEDPEESDHD